MIKQVWINNNGTCFVFNEKGNQMPRYQGVWMEKYAKILQNCKHGVAFYKLNWNTGVKELVLRIENVPTDVSKLFQTQY